MTVSVDELARVSHAVDGSIAHACSQVLNDVLYMSQQQLPDEILHHLLDASFNSSSKGYPVYFPCPFKETEAISALKAIEASTVAAIADVRFKERRRRIDIDVEQATCSLFAAYLSAVNGMGKFHPDVRSRLKDTDLLGAQSILYRRLSANLYATKNPGEYFHIHGSLEATTTLNMIGLDGHRPDLTDYRECIDVIEEHVQQFSAEELEEKNAKNRQAGVTCLKWDEFQKTAHGRELMAHPPWIIEQLDDASPRAPFSRNSGSKPTPQVLEGIRVLELCRIVAGPMIGRTLAEYGADVLKITCSNLSDVPFFQVDGNMGKHTANLDLKCPTDRSRFKELLLSADVILDGYRPGSLDKLGYGPQDIVELIKGRGKGIVYVSEDCFGFDGEWSQRPGWQQIADCVTGIAWAQGQSMGLDEPVVPPFPMSDYGTGCMGSIVALTGLLKRAKWGGSYHGKCSLVQYDMLIQRLGLYPSAVQAAQRAIHDPDFYALRHHDSVDEVGKRAMRSMRRLYPHLFDSSVCHEVPSAGFGVPVKYVRSAVRIEGLRNGFNRSSRPNGQDEPTWDGWETDDFLLGVDQDTMREEH